MPLGNNVEVIKAREGDSTELTDGPEDVSGGKTVYMGMNNGSATSATLFIATDGPIELTVEFSPNGDVWREPQAESPLKFDAAGEDIIFIDYDASYLRVAGSNATGVNLDLAVTA